jgi:hypothetical protein
MACNDLHLTIDDYVSSHGFGSPTPEGFALAADLILTGDDVATAAFEVVARGLTIDLSAPATAGE